MISHFINKHPAAMAFSLGIEIVNMKIRKKSKPITLKKADVSAPTLDVK